MKNDVSRIDTIFDVYDENNENLKQQTHDRRREKQGPEIEITGSIRAPAGRQAWKVFLRVKANKTALFCFLAEKLVEIHSVVTLYATYKEHVLVNSHPFTDESNGLLNTLAPCSHPEADTRIFSHIKDAVEQGHRNVLVRSVDSDIPVIGIGTFDKLSPLKELYVEYGKSKDLEVIPVHELVLALGPKAKALLLFNALTGCDSTSSLIWTGKTLCWGVWDLVPDLTETLITIQSDPLQFSLNSVHMERLERFFILLYSKTCGQMRVNKARSYLFQTSARSLDRMPPSQAALYQHILRALLQAGYIWAQAPILQPFLPPFTDWGWKRSSVGHLVPFWTTLKDASKSCKALHSCTCKTSCTRCKCVVNGFRCTSLCKCEGACANNE